MKLQIATIAVKPEDWAQVWKIANRKGLARSAYIRGLVSEAIKGEAQAARKDAAAAERV